MTNKKGGNGGGGNGGFDAKVQKLVASVAQVGAAVDALGLPALTDEERRTAIGKLRAGEADAMVAIFDAMDAFPGVFAPLAAKDGGVDPNKLETEPAREALADSQSLGPLADELQTVAARVADAVLALATQAKEVSVPAYAIGKAGAASDAKLRKAMAPALDFYGRPAAKRVAKKKLAAGRAKKAAKTAARPSPN